MLLNEFHLENTGARRITEMCQHSIQITKTCTWKTQVSKNFVELRLFFLLIKFNLSKTNTFNIVVCFWRYRTITGIFWSIFFAAMQTPGLHIFLSILSTRARLLKQSLIENFIFEQCWTQGVKYM